jgi:hypothetical protein
LNPGRARLVYIHTLKFVRFNVPRSVLLVCAVTSSSWLNVVLSVHAHVHRWSEPVDRACPWPSVGRWPRTAAARLPLCSSDCGRAVLLRPAAGPASHWSLVPLPRAVAQLLPCHHLTVASATPPLRLCTADPPVWCQAQWRVPGRVVCNTPVLCKHLHCNHEHNMSWHS